MASVTSVLETSLYVADLERSRAFYRELFGFEPMLSDERMCGLNVAGRQVLLLFTKGGSNQTSAVPGGVVPPHDGEGRLHLAFAIKSEELQAWKGRLGQAGIAIEAVITPPQGGTSLYFRDPDGHLIELATPGLWPVY